MNDTTNVRKPRTIHLAHWDKDSLAIMTPMLLSLGHDLALATLSGRELIDRSITHPPEIIISAPRLEDMDGIEALIAIGEEKPIPSIVVAKVDDLDKVERAMENHVMAYLVEPVTAADLEPAIYLAERRLHHMQSLENKVKKLQSRLSERRLVEKAKGIVMRTKSLDEESAHRFLQDAARQNRKPLHDVAQTIVDAADLLQ